MKISIIISKQDLAGMNIANHLDKINITYNLIGQHSINFEQELLEKDKRLADSDFIIFATTHKSEKGTKSLTCHAPGNWRDAKLGGKSGKLCKTSPLFLKQLFITLNEEAKKHNWQYEVSMECTHHGPLINTPCCFLEIGSSEEGWKDEQAGRIIAETIKQVISSKINKTFTPALGIGGKHYCPNFNKIQLNSNYALGHIIPEYALPLTEEMLREALEKSFEKPEIAILDWKAIGKAEERQKLIAILDKFNLKYIRTSEIYRETNNSQD